MKHDELTEEQAVQLLGGVLASETAAVKPRSETLGEALERFRRARHLPLKRMATALGTPYDTFLRWRGDADLPDADALLRICQLLELDPFAVLRMVAETARDILETTLDDACGLPHAVAARQRGADVGGDEESRLLNLPTALRRGLAEQHGLASDDVHGLCAVLRQAAAADEPGRRRFVDGLVGGLELEGEQAF